MKTVVNLIFISGFLSIGVKAQEIKFDSLALDQLLNNTINHESNHPIHAIQFLLASPKHQFFYERSLGYANWEDKTPLSRRHPVVIASITKMVTAVAILKLAELDVIHLETPIGNYLPDHLVRRLLYINGEPRGQEIKVIHLLKHLSGLRDYIMDDDQFLDLVFENPNRQWIPMDIIEHYLRSDLPKNPVDKPGNSFHYSDTNYLILGLIIENVTQQKLAEIYRQLIFEPQKLKNSWLQFYESPSNPSFTPPDTWLGNLNASKINTSFDWGGGGLIMSLDDLYTFTKALFNGLLFEKASTLDQYLSGVSITDHNMESAFYACGVNILKMKNGPRLIGHAGFYKSFLLYLPDVDMYIMGSLNQSNANHRDLINQILEILQLKN